MCSPYSQLISTRFLPLFECKSMCYHGYLKQRRKTRNWTVQSSWVSGFSGDAVKNLCWLLALLRFELISPWKDVSWAHNCIHICGFILRTRYVNVNVFLPTRCGWKRVCWNDAEGWMLYLWHSSWTYKKYESWHLRHVKENCFPWITLPLNAKQLRNI